MKGYALFMFYHLYEMNHAALQPFRAVADAAKLFYSNPLNPLSHSSFGRSMAASAELFERMTRRYSKPPFGLPETVVDGQAVRVTEEVVWSKPFCDLLHFKRDLPKGRKEDSKLLIVAPMSGHYATLLRNTVISLLPDCDVYVTDWHNARDIPVSAGKFDVEDYTLYLVDFMRHLGPDINVVAVCQPAPLTLAATAYLAEEDPAAQPRTMTLIGGPIDPDAAPTEVTDFGRRLTMGQLEHLAIQRVGFKYRGAGRLVYPGLLQLASFISIIVGRLCGSALIA